MLDAIMNEPDYDDPDVEERWCEDQRAVVTDYLGSQKVKHGSIGDWPAWHVAPYASIWAIESLVQPGAIGWWVVCGDLPTDYISSADLRPPQHPRKAMRIFAKNWLELVAAWKDGRELENTRIAGSSLHEELGPLLESRARLLMEWAEDDSLWEER
jgi:Domain of unknown function (DUF4826)